MEQATDVHLRWNNHQTTLLSVFSSLLDNGSLVDCTISAEGQHFKAHRVILSACSTYFELLFSQHYEKHPIVILPDVKFQILKALMEFMYSGEVQVQQDMLCTVLKLAETLQVKGLSYAGGSKTEDKLATKRRSESTVLGVRQGSSKRQCGPRHCSRVVQEDDGSSHRVLEKERPEELGSHQLSTHKCDKDISNPTFSEKVVDEPAMSQDISDTEVFNVFQSSSLTETLTKSNTVSEKLLNPVSNNLDSIRFPSSSKEDNGGQRISSDNVLSTHSSGKNVTKLEPVGMCGKTRAVDCLPELKQEDPDGFRDDSVEEITLDDDIDRKRCVMYHLPEMKQENPHEHTSDSIEEIILDDDIDASDDHVPGGGEDNSNTVGELVGVRPEQSVSDQGSSSVEQYRDSYFVEPTSILANQFRCDVCGRSYQYLRNLMRHLQYECGKEPQFKCPHCPARFTQKHNLIMHMGRNHFPC